MQRPNLTIGILLAIGGFASMTIMDSFAKSIAGAWPATAIATLRFLVQTALLGPLVAWRYGAAGFATPRPGLQVARAAALAAASVFFFTSVMLMPLADATAVSFMNPLLVALMASYFLGERAPAGIVAAILVAFTGVLIILQPNIMAIGWAALLPVGAALCFSTYLILNRLSAGLAPALAMQCVGGTIGAVLLAITAVALHATGIDAFHVGTPSTDTLMKVGAMGVFGTLGHVLLFMASERAPAPIIAPMVYTQIVMATLIGWLWFADPLTASTLGGVALIIVCGLYVWRSSRGKAPPPPVVSESAASS